MKQLFCFLILLFCMSFSYEALAQEERATPKSGEGISGFLQRNGRTGKAYYQEFLELNKKQLRGKEELRLGVKYLLPPLKWQYGCFIQFICFKLFCFKFFCPFRQQNNS